jgi:hypothetical protein
MTNNKVFDALDKTFETKTKELETAKPVIEKAINDGLDSDFQEARDALKRAMVYGEEAIQGIMNVATNSDNPRAYEVAGQLIKSLSDQAKDMMDIQAKKKKIDETDGKPSVSKIGHQTNVLFNGSTSDLMKALKEDDAPIIEGEVDGSSD